MSASAADDRRHAGCLAAASAQRNDCATVSAGILQEQLAAAQSLNDVLAVAEHAQSAGDFAGAIRQYEQARDMARSEKLLAEHQDRVLDKLGRNYLDGGRASDAVATYTALLRLGTTTAGRGLTKFEGYAAAKQSLGYSEMVAGDFHAALPFCATRKLTSEQRRNPAVLRNSA